MTPFHLTIPLIAGTVDQGVPTTAASWGWGKALVGCCPNHEFIVPWDPFHIHSVDPPNLRQELSKL